MDDISASRLKPRKLSTIIMHRWHVQIMSYCVANILANILINATRDVNITLDKIGQTEIIDVSLSLLI